MTAQTDQLLVFRTGGHSFAVGIGEIVDVLRMAAVRPLPGTPDWLLGVLNLRGVPVPIIHIGHRLGLCQARIHPDDRVIVATTKRGLAGGVVDEVGSSMVVADGSEAIDDRLPAEAVSALVRIGLDLVPVLDLPSVWDPGEPAAEKLAEWLT